MSRVEKNHFLCFDRSRIWRTLRIWWTSHKWWTYFWTYFVRRYDRPEFSKFPKIPVFFWRVVLNFDYFWTGVLDLSFGNIFGKFRKTFLGGPKPLFFWNCFDRRKTRKVTRPGKSKGRESRKAKNFRPTQCLSSQPFGVVGPLLTSKSVHKDSLNFLTHTADTIKVRVLILFFSVDPQGFRHGSLVKDLRYGLRIKGFLRFDFRVWDGLIYHEF